ncbi:hypothetical protein C0991_012151 [Blastosporella zonata]|nr:hypothetical protein C0991_012151 [Blastosporella zonata]
MSYVIDDRDPSKVTYNGTWIPGGLPDENNGTVSSSTNVGDFFTVSFTGINIAVFGTFDITSGGVETTYSLDGYTPVTVVSQAGSNDTHHQQFWRSNDVEPTGNHKLLVNMTKVNSDPQAGEGTVWFDYFLVTDPAITTSSHGNPNTSQPASRPSSNASANIGAIVGSIIGGLFFLLGVVFLYLFYLRKVRMTVDKRTIEESFPKDDRPETIVQPFRLTLADTLPVRGSTATTIITEPFDGSTGTLISGGPHMASRKSVASVRPATGHSPQASIGNSSNVAFVTVEPLPDLLAANVVHARDKRHRLRVDADAVPQGSPTAASQHPDPAPETEPVALQHVDSGMRAGPSTGEPGALTVRVELPPVYSPS